MNSPYYTDDQVTLYLGDCRRVLSNLAPSSIDAVVCDPPYDLTSGKKGGNGAGNGAGGFMGQAWDATGVAFDPATWAEVLRVLKPGGHLLAFGGTRTFHRLAVAIEDAEFEIRDSIAWLYGSGFPKSLDVSKAIDKAAGVGREVMATERSPFRMVDPFMGDVLESTQSGDTRKVDADGYIVRPITAPATDDARTWQGWGTALKPAFEPVVVGRKPLAGTVAANVLAHGTGALNIDACRIPTDDILTGSGTPPLQYGWANHRPFHDTAEARGVAQHSAGRWPANVVLDKSQAADLDQQGGTSRSQIGTPRGAASGVGWGMTATGAEYDDQGGASRFFPTFRYEAKAPSHERPRDGDTAHPTVKPLDLMRWLVRLVTPPGGTVLDPFLGSGTTAEACVIEGFRCIGIERESAYLDLAVLRLSKAIQPDIFGSVS